jgi:hypothetical protein
MGMMVLICCLFAPEYPLSGDWSILDSRRVFSYRSGEKRMKQVTIRLELRVSEEMNEFLQMQSQSRKLSFEGLILMYLDEQMKKERQDRQHNGPRRA